MIRNSDINDPQSTEMHRDVCIILVISYQFRIISVIEGFTLPVLALCTISAMSSARAVFFSAALFNSKFGGWTSPLSNPPTCGRNGCYIKELT
jgi:hypothetical protein